MKDKTKVACNYKPFLSVLDSHLAWTIVTTIAIVIAPAVLAHTPNNQIITGSIVNALLFFAAYKLPLINALLIAIIPSSIALLRGLLPAPMALLIPYIMTSNLILILSFKSLKKFPVAGVIISSLAKFIFLYSVTLFFAEKLNSNLIIMFQLPQLITALVGGLTIITAIKIFETNDQL